MTVLFFVDPEQSSNRYDIVAINPVKMSDGRLLDLRSCEAVVCSYLDWRVKICDPELPSDVFDDDLGNTRLVSVTPAKENIERTT